LNVHKVDLYPLKVVLIYISFGVLLSFFGPIGFYDYDRFPVAVYMLSFLFLFTVGYILGVINSKFLTTNIDYNLENYKLSRVLYWVKFCVVLIACVQMVTLVVGVYEGSLNLSIYKLGEAYVRGYEGYVRGTGQVSFLFFIQTITYVPYLIVLILGAYYFKDLPKYYKALVVFTYISIILLETIGQGKQKQLGDILIILIVVIFLRSDLLSKAIRKRIFKKILVFAFIGMNALITILYFRYTALGVNALNINSKTHSLMEFNTDHLIFKIFGDDVGFPITIFTAYFSQGYYGLSLAMRQPFEWTYFMGSSYSLSVFLNRYLGVPIDFRDTYPYRVALVTGWDDTKWSTVFVWFAGDLTFIGTLFMFALVAYLYAKVWIESYRFQNPISIVIFVMLTIALLYVPANNQLLHTPGSFIAVFYFLALWGLKHKKYNFYISKIGKHELREKH